MKHKEVTLDPENWEELRTLGHQMLDDHIEYLKNIRNQPYIPLTEEAKSEIQTKLPC